MPTNALPVRRRCHARPEERIALTEVEGLEPQAHAAITPIQRVRIPLVWLAPSGRNGYRILAGRRQAERTHAAGLTRLRALVSTLAPADAERAAALDLRTSAVDRAELIHLMRELADIPDSQAAEIIGIDRQDAWRLRACREQPELLQSIDAGTLSSGHIRYLLGIPDPAARLQWARRACSESWGVAELRNALRGTPRTPRSAPMPDANMQAYQRDLSERLQTAVEIQGGQAGAGTLRLRFSTMQELQGLMEKLAPPGCPESSGHTKARTLQIEFCNPDELDELVGHLFRESDW